MNKRIVHLMAAALALLLLLTAGGAAEEGIPREVLEHEFGGQVSEIRDQLAIRDASGRDWWLLIHTYGWASGYCQQEGEWVCCWSGAYAPEAEDTRFEKLSDTSFEIKCESLDIWLRYEARDEGFALVGWRDGNAWPGTVEIQEGAVTFRPDDGGEPVQIPIGEELAAWLTDFEYMAKTPEDMQARAAIGREPTADRMPGWTLAYYDIYNTGTAAEAGFYRIEDGKLTVSRMTLYSDQEATEPQVSAAVPLSQTLLQKLETDGPEGLLDVSGYGSTFLTDDAWDRKIIPIQGKIIESDLQTSGLLALTERDGRRYIAVAEQDETGAWQVRETKPMPIKADWDLFHCGDGEIGLWWPRDDENENQCGFFRQSDGSWRLSWVWAGECDYSLTCAGVITDFDGAINHVYAYGTPAFADLFEMTLDELPGSQEALLRGMETAGWAAVLNPNSRDRLRLRAEPSRDGAILGKFYNGTPLQVLETKGEWCRVRVGKGQALEGWMMKEYLAFGDRLHSVRTAYPEQMLREEMEGKTLYLNEEKAPSAIRLTYLDTVIGITEDGSMWIVMTDEGDVGYAEKDWYWEGNG